ncbi:GntR family transcriptional regulator YhfZ [Clostridium sp. DMHC 10]|uniref:GntR family transcriptional regulator YhfZ n=1 Tax=Clostridium sp. DMHC 10 TaxID=747377 RepID=UPI00241F4D01|nr:GntR family transcriptional regulator YhfZ [Clostridium sp. DMHC 10]
MNAKNGIIAMKLAQEFLSKECGERIDTISNYSEKFDIARGTVQNAVRFLQDERAISLEARGHMGTFIVKINYEKLLEVSGIGSIVGVMPLPYSKLYEGIATGFYNTMEKSKIPFNLAYMRGAANRIESLSKGRYDFALISKLAAENLMETENLEIIMDFGEFSYVSEHAIIFHDFSKRNIENGMRIGVDNSSIDHKILTQRQCSGKKVIMVELPYNQVISKVMNGEIDAAIWNIDEIIDRKINLKYYPMSSKNDNKDTNAVVVVESSKNNIKAILKRYLRKSEILDMQKKIVKGEMVPRY